LGKVTAQTGTKFWFAAPEVTSGNSDQPILLRISSYDVPALVTISQPANTNFTQRSVNVGVNQMATIDLTSDIFQVENSPVNTVLNYGLLIVSTESVSVYYEVKSNDYNTEIFNLKADKALGVNFVIPGQTSFSNDTSFSPQAYATVDIVATEDNTQIIFNPNGNLIYIPQSPYSTRGTLVINLDKGEAYSLRGADGGAGVPSGKLEGSLVPIAITLKDDSNGDSGYGICSDLLGDQLLPMSQIGTEYIIVKGFL